MIRIETALGEDAELRLTDAQRDALGGGVDFPVVATVNGTEIRTAVLHKGDFTGIVFDDEQRAKAGMAPGDTVLVELRRDTGQNADPAP